MKQLNKMKNLPQPPTRANNLTRTRGDKRSKDQETRLMSDIFSLSSNHNDYEIMDILKIPNSTYYRYKTEMHKQAKELWTQTYKDSLEYRALHLINSFNFVAKINQEIALDPNQKAQDRIEASRHASEAQLRLFFVIRDGPKLIEQHSMEVLKKLSMET